MGNSTNLINLIFFETLPNAETLCLCYKKYQIIFHTCSDLLYHSQYPGTSSVMDLRPNRRLDFTDFFSDESDEQNGDNLIEDDSSDLTDDDPLNDSLPSIPDQNMLDPLEEFEVGGDEPYNIDEVEEEEVGMEMVEQNDEQLLERASCPGCGMNILEAQLVFLQTSCGHVQCGACHAHAASNEICAICGNGGGNLELKL